jgi:hypothetical protein
MATWLASRYCQKLVEMKGEVKHVLLYMVCYSCEALSFNLRFLHVRNTSEQHENQRRCFSLGQLSHKLVSRVLLVTF